MKRLLLIIGVLMCLGSHSQNMMVVVQGAVYDMSVPGFPVPVANQTVYITIDSTNTGFTAFDSVKTNPAGIFTFQKMLAPGTVIGQLTLSTWDHCLQSMQSSTEIITGGGVYSFLLEICGNLPDECQAAFTYHAFPGDLFTIKFEDWSFTGNGGPPTGWLWEFGDGTFSTIREPQHTYTIPGNYVVCLTIFDSTTSCVDKYCEQVVVGDTASPLIASFIARLDTLDPTPNLFEFKSTSSGDVDMWLWDFGDGKTAEGPIVSHQFDGSGTFSVCLTIVDTGYIPQRTDTYCGQISTPDYTFFGGQVFAGDFPLNNPFHQGDTARVYLYKHLGEQIVPFDTNVFWNEGLYAFNYLLDGNYIVKVELSEHSTSHGSYLPTYYPSSVTWQESQIMTLEDPVYSAHVHLVPAADIGSGPGVIRGRVGFVNETGLTSYDLVLDFEVLLFNDMGEPLTFNYTDQEGNFEFTALPYGTYTVVADHTGWSSSSQTITLGPNNSLAENIDLELSSGQPFGFGEGLVYNGSAIVLYPNPAIDRLNILLPDNFKGSCRIDIFDIAGRLMQEGTGSTSGGETKITLDVSRLPAGTYLVRLHGNSGNFHGIKRFIK